MTEIYRQPKRRKLDQLIKREPESTPTLEERLAKVSESSEQRLQESSEKGAAMELSIGNVPARENTTEKDTTSVPVLLNFWFDFFINRLCIYVISSVVCLESRMAAATNERDCANCSPDKY